MSSQNWSYSWVGRRGGHQMGHQAGRTRTRTHTHTHTQTTTLLQDTHAHKHCHTLSHTHTHTHEHANARTHAHTETHTRHPMVHSSKRSTDWCIYMPPYGRILVHTHGHVLVSLWLGWVGRRDILKQLQLWSNVFDRQCRDVVLRHVILDGHIIGCSNAWLRANEVRVSVLVLKRTGSDHWQEQLCQRMLRWWIMLEGPHWTN